MCEDVKAVEWLLHEYIVQARALANHGLRLENIDQFVRVHACTPKARLSWAFKAMAGPRWQREWCMLAAITACDGGFACGGRKGRLLKPCVRSIEAGSQIAGALPLSQGQILAPSLMPLEGVAKSYRWQQEPPQSHFPHRSQWATVFAERADGVDAGGSPTRGVPPGELRAADVLGRCHGWARWLHGAAQHLPGPDIQVCTLKPEILKRGLCLSRRAPAQGAAPTHGVLHFVPF